MKFVFKYFCPFQVSSKRIITDYKHNKYIQTTYKSSGLSGYKKWIFKKIKVHKYLSTQFGETGIRKGPGPTGIPSQMQTFSFRVSFLERDPCFQVDPVREPKHGGSFIYCWWWLVNSTELNLVKNLQMVSVREQLKQANKPDGKTPLSWLDPLQDQSSTMSCNS